MGSRALLHFFVTDFVLFVLHIVEKRQLEPAQSVFFCFWMFIVEDVAYFALVWGFANVTQSIIFIFF